MFGCASLRESVYSRDVQEGIAAATRQDCRCLVCVSEYMTSRGHLESDFGEGLSVWLRAATWEYPFTRGHRRNRRLHEASSQVLNVGNGALEVSGPIVEGFW